MDDQIKAFQDANDSPKIVVSIGKVTDDSFRITSSQIKQDFNGFSHFQAAPIDPLNDERTATTFGGKKRNMRNPPHSSDFEDSYTVSPVGLQERYHHTDARMHKTNSVDKLPNQLRNTRSVDKLPSLVPKEFVPKNLKPDLAPQHPYKPGKIKHESKRGAAHKPPIPDINETLNEHQFVVATSMPFGKTSFPNMHKSNSKVRTEKRSSSLQEFHPDRSQFAQTMTNLDLPMIENFGQKCTFILPKQDPSLDQLEEQTKQLQTIIETREAEDQKKQLVRFLKKKMEQAYSTNDLKLLGKTQHNTNNPLNVSKEMDLNESVMKATNNQFNLARLSEMLNESQQQARSKERAKQFESNGDEAMQKSKETHEYEEKKESFPWQTIQQSQSHFKFKQVNNINIIQNVIQAEAPKDALISELQELDIKKLQLERNVQKAVKMLNSNEIQLDEVLGQKAFMMKPEWTMTKQFCQDSLAKIPQVPDTVPHRLWVGLGRHVIIEQPEDNSAELTSEQVASLKHIQDTNEMMIKSVEAQVLVENKITGSKLDPKSIKVARAYQYMPRGTERLDSVVVDPEFDKSYTLARIEKTNFTENFDPKLKALRLLRDESMDQLRTISSSKTNVLDRILNQIADVHKARLKQAESLNNQIVAELVDTLKSVTYEMQHQLLENRRRDKVIIILLDYIDQLRTSNELALKLYSKVDEERQIKKREHDNLKYKILEWFPNFVKYYQSDIFKFKLEVILPNHSTLSQLNGIEFWQTQMLNVDYDTEADMWGLENQELSQIEYKDYKVIDYQKPYLWLRSDMCRLEKLLDVPTVRAVEAWTYLDRNIKLTEKDKQSRKALVEKSTDYDILLGHYQNQHEKLKETLEQLSTFKQKCKELEASLEALRNRGETMIDKHSQTDKSSKWTKTIVKKEQHYPIHKVPGAMGKSKSAFVNSHQPSPERKSSVTGLPAHKMQANIQRINVPTVSSVMRREASRQSARQSDRYSSGDSVRIKLDHEEKDYFNGDLGAIKERTSTKKKPQYNDDSFTNSAVKFQSLDKSPFNVTDKSSPPQQQPTVQQAFRNKLCKIDAPLENQRVSELEWPQFAHRYKQMQEVFKQLVQKAPSTTNMLDVLWQGMSLDIQKQQQVQDIINMANIDWRADLLLKTCSLEFQIGEKDDIGMSKMEVNFNKEDVFAANICAKLLKKFKIDVASLFKFKEQKDILIGDSMTVNFHEAFTAITAETVKNMSPQALVSFGAPLMAYIYNELKAKCTTVTASKIGQNLYPDCLIENSQTIEISPEQKHATDEIHLLKEIIRKLSLNDTRTLIGQLPISIADFKEALLKEPFNMKNLPDDFESYCKKHITEGRSQFDLECVKRLEKMLISHQLRYEDVLRIGVKAKTFLDQSMEHNLKHIFDQQAHQHDQQMPIPQFKILIKKLVDKCNQLDRVQNAARKEKNQSKRLKIMKEVFDELDMRLYSKQITGITLSHFRSLFDVLEINYSIVLNNRPKLHKVSEQKINVLHNMTAYLRQTFSNFQDTEPSELADDQNYLNLEVYQMALRFEEMNDQLPLKDIKFLLFGEVPVSEEISPPDTKGLEMASDQTQQLLETNTPQPETFELKMHATKKTDSKSNQSTPSRERKSEKSLLKSSIQHTDRSKLSPSKAKAKKAKAWTQEEPSHHNSDQDTPKRRDIRADSKKHSQYDINKSKQLVDEVKDLLRLFEQSKIDQKRLIKTLKKELAEQAEASRDQDESFTSKTIEMTIQGDNQSEADSKSHDGHSDALSLSGDDHTHQESHDEHNETIEELHSNEEESMPATRKHTKEKAIAKRPNGDESLQNTDSLDERNEAQSLSPDRRDKYKRRPEPVQTKSKKTETLSKKLKASKSLDFDRARKQDASSPDPARQTKPDQAAMYAKASKKQVKLASNDASTSPLKLEARGEQTHQSKNDQSTSPIRSKKHEASKKMVKLASNDASTSPLKREARGEQTHQSKNDQSTSPLRSEKHEASTSPIKMQKNLKGWQSIKKAETCDVDSLPFAKTKTDFAMKLKKTADPDLTEESDESSFPEQNKGTRQPIHHSKSFYNGQANGSRTQKQAGFKSVQTLPKFVDQKAARNKEIAAVTAKSKKKENEIKVTKEMIEQVKVTFLEQLQETEINATPDSIRSLASAAEKIFESKKMMQRISEQVSQLQQNEPSDHRQSQHDHRQSQHDHRQSQHDHRQSQHEHFRTVSDLRVTQQPTTLELKLPLIQHASMTLISDDAQSLPRSTSSISPLHKKQVSKIVRESSNDPLDMLVTNDPAQFNGPFPRPWNFFQPSLDIVRRETPERSESFTDQQNEKVTNIVESPMKKGTKSPGLDENKRRSPPRKGTISDDQLQERMKSHSPKSSGVTRRVMMLKDNYEWLDKLKMHQQAEPETIMLDIHEIQNPDVEPDPATEVMLNSLMSRLTKKEREKDKRHAHLQRYAIPKQQKIKRQATTEVPSNLSISGSKAFPTAEQLADQKRQLQQLVVSRMAIQSSASTATLRMTDSVDSKPKK